MSKVPFDKIKLLDEYAKSLGMTIYGITLGFEQDGQTFVYNNAYLNKHRDAEKLTPERKEEFYNIVQKHSIAEYKELKQHKLYISSTFPLLGMEW